MAGVGIGGVRRGGLVLLLGLIIGCGPPADPVPPLPELNLGQFEPAVQDQLALADAEARAAAPGHLLAAAAGRLGTLLLAYGEMASAQQAFHRAAALATDSGRLPWVYRLAWAQLAQGDLAGAEAGLRHYLTHRPNAQEAQLQLAKVLLQDSRPEEALPLLEQLASDPGADPETHLLQGQALQQLGQIDAAVASLHAALAAEPAWGAAHYALALAYRELGQDAQRDHHLARFRADEGKRPLPHDPLHRELQQVRVGASALAVQAKQLVAAGRLEAGRDKFLAALAADPDYLPAHVALIYVQWQMGDVAAAEHHFRAATALDAGAARAWLNWGMVLSSLGRHADAADAFGRTVRLNPAGAVGHTFLGYANEELGEHNTAVASYEEALRREPNQARARFLLGRQQLRAGDRGAAEENFQRALQERGSGATWFLQQIGLAYGAEGDRELAMEYLRRAEDHARRHGQKRLLQDITAVLQANAIAEPAG